MKYLGSKRRIAKEILPIMLDGRRPNQYWVEPFVGGANVLSLVDGPRLGADAHPYLIALLSAVRDGYIPPDAVPEDMYKAVRSKPQDYPPELVGFVGFLCSFSGLWMHGYARGRNYAAEGRRALAKQAPTLQGAELVCCKYEDLVVPPNSIIYCDPPYAGTTKYNDVSIDHDAFWQWCRDKKSEGHTVYVSEYSAPDDVECVYESEVRCMVASVGHRTHRTERLYRL